MFHRQDVIPFRQALRVWFSISLRTFGGPAGQIAVMHKELVDDRRWIGEHRFLHALSYCTLLPGPEAQQLAIYLGWLLNGTGGGLAAGILFVLPGYVTMMILSGVYAKWGETTAITALFAGIGPAVLAVVLQAVIRVGKRSLRNKFLVGIAVCSFISLTVVNIPFPVVILLAGLAGFTAARKWPGIFNHPASSEVAGAQPPLIADDALHGTRPSLKRAVRIIVIGIILWGVPVLVAALALGRSHVFVEQGLFFSGTAVVTFGGAYAVLSYVAQRAVHVFGWLLPGEMIRGLALAETTPGPLIMVVQFVAFLGAFRNPGTMNPWVAGLIGSSLVVWVTFVPCFLFVFLGAPHVEGLRGNRHLSAALTGIMAAVVGVIANLSLFFSVHTLFSIVERKTWGIISMDIPRWSSVDPRAIIVALFAFYAVFSLKWGVLRLLACCAGIGAVLHFVSF